jgi:hypothetical protein
MPLRYELILGKSIARKRNLDGSPIGISAESPIFDTRVYLAEFPDNSIEEHSDRNPIFTSQP